MISLNLFKTKLISLASICFLSVILFACNGDNGPATPTNTTSIKNTRNPNVNTGIDGDDKVYTSYSTSESFASNSLLYQYIYAATSNKIEVLYIESNGNLTSHAVIQTGLPSSTAISALIVTPHNEFLYAAVKDGNNDKILMYQINIVDGGLIPLATPTLSTNDNSISSIAISKDNKFIYTTSSSQICSYKIAHDGQLTKQTCITSGITPYQQIILSTSNRYAYVISGKNRNNLLYFNRESETGTLLAIGSRTVANNSMGLISTPGYSYLYDVLKDNHAIGQYKVNPETGMVNPLTPETSQAGLEPHSIVVSPGSRFAYAANYYDKTISMYSISSSSGLLSKLSPNSILTESNPDKLVIDKRGKYLYATSKSGQIMLYQINESTGQLSAVRSGTKILSSGINAVAIGQIRRGHVYLEESTLGASLGLESNVTFLVGADEEVDTNSLKFTLNRTESNIGDLSHTSTNVQTSSALLVAVGFAITTIAAGQYMLDPVDLEVPYNKGLILGVDGYFKNGAVLPHQEYRFATKLTLPIVTSPTNLDAVDPHASFRVLYPYHIDETIVNDDTLYLVRKGESQHIPAKITITLNGGDGDCSIMGWLTGWCNNDKTSEAGEATSNPDNPIPAGEYDLVIGDDTSETATITDNTDEYPMLYLYATSAIVKGDFAHVYTRNAELDPRYESDEFQNLTNPLDRADYICQNDDNKPNNSDYKAMIATLGIIPDAPDNQKRYACSRGYVYGTYCGDDYAKNWVLYPSSKYKNWRDEYLATTTTDATLPTMLDIAISYGNNSPRYAWTGMRRDWTTSQSTCEGWTSIATGIAGRYGEPTFPAVGFYLSTGIRYCTLRHAIYCAEQRQE